MHKKVKNLIFTTITIMLAVLAVIYIYNQLRGENGKVALNAVKNANYIWFFASVFLAAISYWCRAKRWKLMLDSIEHPINTIAGFWSISFTYFMNLVIPRSGELARATSLYATEKVPVETSLGTIVTERIIDLLFLVLFIVFTFVFYPEPLFSFLEKANVPVKFNLGILSIIIVGTTVLLIILYYSRKKIFPSHIYQKIKKFLNGFREGILSVLKVKEKGLFIIYTIGIWICYFFMTYVVVFAFQETQHFTIDMGLVLMVAGAVGMILPVSGGLSYPIVVSQAVGAIFYTQGYPFDEMANKIGLPFSLSIYFSQLIFVFVMGLLAMVYISKNKKEDI